jgi:hypothetical protein
VIQKGIVVEVALAPAIVESVDPRTRTIVLRRPGGTWTHAYAVGQRVSNLDRIIVGDKVQAELAEDLTVYVSEDRQLPADDPASGVVTSDARVLAVDRSYRVMTLRYPDGRSEMLKVGREAKLGEMETGDDVVIRALELVSLAPRTRSDGS